MNTASSLEDYLGDDTLLLPDRLDDGAVGSLLASLHDPSGGATVSPWFGNLAGRRGFAVSLYPERTVRLLGRQLPEPVMRIFLAENSDILTDPRNCIGSWYNPAEDTTYLDVSSVVPSLAVAARIARAFDQIAIFDLHRLEEILIGGSGRAPYMYVPLIDRLPPLRRRRRRRP